MQDAFSNFMRKVGFLVLDLTWKLFSQTGNIETYLLLKELESDRSIDGPDLELDIQDVSPLD